MVQVCFYTDKKLGEVSLVSFACLQVKQVNGKRVFKLTGYVEMAPRYGINELKNVVSVREKCQIYTFYNKPILKAVAGGVVLPNRVCA